MKDLAEAFESDRDSVFLIEGEKKISFGEFLDLAGDLGEEIKKLKLKTNSVTVQPNNSSLSLAFIFALLSLDLKPSLISRREVTRSAMFTFERIKELSKQTKVKTFKTPSLDLNREIFFWTSGTSSKPKEAILTLASFYENALSSSENIIFEKGDRWLLSLPVEHVGGFSILFRALISGGSVVLVEPGDLFLPDEITHLSFVSTQLYRYVKNPKPLPNLKALLLGGSAFPWELIQNALRLGLRLYKSYGMTEMASQISTTKTQNSEEFRSSGHVLPRLDVKIVDSQIYVRGPSQFLGYRRHHEIEKPFDSEGWFKTNDRGEWTTSGALQVLGRFDRLFVSAGENVQPEFIERALLDYPGILKARVVPEKSDEYGFTPRAFISADGDWDSAQLHTFLRQRLTGIQMPKVIQDWSLMPDHYRNAKDL